MSEQQPGNGPENAPEQDDDQGPVVEGETDEGPAAELGEGTDVGGLDAAGTAGAPGDLPATSDPESFTEDSTLGGTGGQNAGGAG